MKTTKKLLAVLLAVMILGGILITGAGAVTSADSNPIARSNDTYCVKVGVVYDVNGGDPSSLTEEHYAFPHQTVTLPVGYYPWPPIYTVLPGPTRTDYIFLGWRLNNYDESLLQPGDTFYGYGWWTLKAVWSPRLKAAQRSNSLL